MTYTRIARVCNAVYCALKDCPKRLWRNELWACLSRLRCGHSI